jgi:hypothetical protein
MTAANHAPAPIAQIAGRLRKLVLLLSSNRDGEVVGAARAIDRALRSAGCDWHDLIKLLDRTPTNTDGTADQFRNWHPISDMIPLLGCVCRPQRWRR